MRPYHLLFLFLLCLSFTTNAQKLDHVLGDVLIKVSPETNMRMLANRLQYFDGKKTSFETLKLISPQLDIWKCHFDQNTINEEHFLNYLKRHPMIEEAQYNHWGEFRQIPNDPDFATQWHWLNDGSSGGLVDADIDSDLAWDITTGGLTANGDTIVVAIIDDGIDLDHPDLVDNLWYNYNEIPNNGIDDDNNGYVDDYLGWNPGPDNDNVDNGSHGVNVAGMIGAVGNNGIGVVGVNWNVKMMTIVGGSGDEAANIEAYSYALWHRQRWNETNGQEGAFVVATNSSWGVDGGQPDDAPLWCGFYDTMGESGILSCGATANVDWDIDIQGDLPTACPSDYMISVTATNDSDVRTFSAFGVINVDLGAPGEDVYTTSSGGGYTTTSGTSFASPTVAGVIALMYAAPCSNIASLAIADPSEAALQVRDYLYQGVDVIPNLVGEVATGGRVNVNNSIQLLLENCGPCPAPAGISTVNLLDISTDLAWIDSDSTVSVNLRWREVGAAMWNNETNVASPFGISGLTACTDYEVELEAICADTTSGYSNTFTFQSDGCCIAPDDLSVTGITTSEATANWGSILAAESYNIQIREVGGTWMTQNVTGTTVDFSDLNSCAEYELQIETVCANNVLTGFSSSVFFTTFGCGACTDFSYCASSGANSALEWIAGVQLNTLDNPTGDDGGYADYTGPGTELVPSGVYEINLVPGFDGFDYNEYWKVWIDFSQDGVFDPNELVFDSGEAVAVPVSGNISVPFDAAFGLTRMRVSMKYIDPSDACEDGFPFGEVEDYCVNIVDGVPPCVIPTNLAAIDITDFFVMASWNLLTSADEYTVRYRETGGGAWSSFTTTDASFALEDLIPCTEYELQIQASCSGDLTDFSQSTIFTTTGCGACIDLNYCESYAENTFYEYIGSVAINGEINNTGDDAGYGLFVDAFSDLYFDTTYQLFLNPIYTDFEYDVYFKVWIDFNQDGIFDDDSELVLDQGPTTTLTNGSFTVPSDAAEGNTRMRVSMKEFGTSDACEIFTFGEVEDYCLNIGSSIVPCDMPMNIDVVSVNENSVNLTWEAGGILDISYNLRYREMGTNDWEEITTIETMASINNLSECKEYEVQVRTICPEQLTNYTESFVFETVCSVNTNELAFDNTSINVFPNPFIQQLSFDIELSGGQELDIVLVNALGQVVRQESKGTFASGKHLLQVENVNTLEKGLYFLVIKLDKQLAISKKVLKID